MSQSKPVNFRDPALPRSPVMTVEQVAEYLQCHPSTIYRLLRKHAIPAWKLGADWRFSIESIERWRKEAEQALSVSVG